MTRDDIAAIWQKLVLKHTKGGACNFQFAADELAALVAAAEREAWAAKLQSLRAQAYFDGHKAGKRAEREACAKVCEDMKEDYGKHAYAFAIRARGQT
jgi:hypothetical protein